MLHRQKAFLKPGHSFGIGTEYSFEKKKFNGRIFLSKVRFDLEIVKSLESKSGEIRWAKI